MTRSSNQDMVLARRGEGNGPHLFLVADGMGGHANGGQASRAVADGMSEWFADGAAGLTDAAATLFAARDRLEEINSRILDTWGREQACGSTCVLLLLFGDVYGILSSGDSRIYLRRGLSCTALTKDDVWENQESVCSRLTGKQIRRDPNYGRLVHAVGIQTPLACSMQTGMLRKGDIFALCSDGVYKMCPGHTFRNMLRFCGHDGLDVLKNRIRDMVYRGGAKDNLSLILVRCR